MGTLSWMCLVWLAASVAAGQSPLRFHEPFEKPTPGLSLMDGKIGQAATLPETGMRVATAGHLDKRQGTICLWIRPQWDGGQRVNHGFVADEIDFNRIGDNNLYLWYWSVGSLRFDVRDPKDSYLTFDVKGWHADQWRHVAAAWDCTKGLRLFVDGRLTQSIRQKIQKLQEGLRPRQQQGKDLSCVSQIMQLFESLTEKGKLHEANAVLDRALDILEWTLERIQQSPQSQAWHIGPLAKGQTRRPPAPTSLQPTLVV